MSSIIRRDTVAAGATLNLFANQQYEFIPFDAQVELGIVGSANGLVVTVYAGPDLVMQEGPVPVQVAANRFAQYPEDFYLSESVAGGTRMSAQVRNTTGGALDCFTTVRLTGLM